MDRRRFLASTGALALLVSGSLPRTALAATQRELTVSKRSIEVNGRAASVFGLNDASGISGLRLTAGEDFDILLRNATAEKTIVHWHGLKPPWESDGVADAPLPLIEAGADRAFQFPVRLPGTYWMHAHTLQEQALLAAPLIVADANDAARDEQEIVVLLHDFSFTPAGEILENLRKGMSPGGMMDMTGGGVSGMDMSSGSMAMDLNDITYDAFLANDRTLDDPEVFAVERGGQVRLRIINGATATAFTLDTGAVDASLIAVDGHDIVPRTGRRFPLTMGQRIDLRLALPAEPGAFPILALREGGVEQTGIVLRTPGAPLPKLATTAAAAGPILDLQLESQLTSLMPLANRAADRSFKMRLSGTMAGYQWAIDTNAPILAKPGERIEVTMTNASMMAHPMHLHGHHFQVVGISGRRLSGAVRDTVLVPPMRSVTIAVDADNVGQWAFHCHHLYHMAAGMMSTFGYAA